MYKILKRKKRCRWRHCRRAWPSRTLPSAWSTACPGRSAVPHGFSNAMLLPAVLEYSKDACVERLADIGRIFSPDEEMTDEEAAERTVQAVKELCHSLNIPNLKEWGIDEQEFMNAREKKAKDALDSGSPANNPKVPTSEEIMGLYQVCYDYLTQGKVGQKVWKIE